MGKKVILTGATGMNGEGVLHVCLSHPAIEAILVIGRHPCGIKHPRLREILIQDLSDLSAIESQLSGYDACFYCMGISLVGKMDHYYETTYTVTLGFARTLARCNPGMVFCYLSAAGADRTETSRLELTRVKGKTENALSEISTLSLYCLRPALIKPMKGMHHTHTLSHLIRFLYPLGSRLYPAAFCTLEQLALAMIHLSIRGDQKKIITGNDIIRLAYEK